MRVAAIQMGTGDDPGVNLARALALVERTDADMSILPEVFVHPTRHDDGEAVAQMRAKARERSIWLGGSLLAKGYNTLFLVDPHGEIAAQYRKIHLFDVPGLGSESGHMKPGTEVVTAQVGDLKVGLTICYDLRFPELFRAQAADLYLVPSAFTAKTGRDHWEVLLRARAIENLAYVVAPNQEGILSTGMETWGHSMIVDPWGRVLAEASGEGPIVADVDRARVTEARLTLPALSHRKI